MKKNEKFDELVKGGVLPKDAKADDYNAKAVTHLHKVMVEHKEIVVLNQELNKDNFALKEENESLKKPSETTGSPIPAEKASKTLSVTNQDNAKELVSDIEIVGADKNQWVLLTKAYSRCEGWMKSTKGLQINGGVLVQVSTQQGDNVSEALTYVPGARLVQHKQFNCWTIV